MSFFQKVKTKLGDVLDDVTTIEHVGILEDGESQKAILYQRQEIEGDSVYFIAEEQVSQEQIMLFNSMANGSMKARTDLVSFIIDCIK
ncbi:MAG: hypothetical protein AAFX87_16225 [Bacteroidota bacterium]